MSYRRDENAGYAGRLADNLGVHFGKDQIFMDRDNIRPGEDFVHVIENAVGSCEILIAVIGPNWSAGGKTGRLSDPNDFVRPEIATALNRDIRVIPVLVQKATMPSPQDLPDDLKKLSRRNALELTDAGWQRDVDQLIKAIQEIRDRFGDPPPRPPPGPPPGTRPAPQPTPFPVNKQWLIVGATFIVVMVIAVVWFIKSSVAPNQAPASGNANLSLSAAEPAKKLEPPDGMVYVPGGEFMLGRDDGDAYERPAHRETLKAFFIDTYEVTCGDYEKFVKEESTPRQRGGKAARALRVPRGKPVTGVAWGDAVAYCYARSKKLPTEQQWEYAARGTDGRRYPWGNEWRVGMANAVGASGGMVDVGSYPNGKTPFGAFDMVGNAWEWTTADMTAYPDGKLPEQPQPGTKVLRGGTYLSKKHEATATYRLGWKASGALNYATTGFRCVKDAAESSPEK